MLALFNGEVCGYDTAGPVHYLARMPALLAVVLAGLFYDGSFYITHSCDAIWPKD